MSGRKEIVVALNMVMFGPPGAGKGTQASRLAQRRRIPQISTGDILREAVQAGTELGKKAKAIIEQGELVSDDVMVAIVRERLLYDDAKHGFILDGFPRTVSQAVELEGILKGRDSLVVVELVVPDETLVLRLSRRRMCEQCGIITGTEGGAPKSRCDQCGQPLITRSDDREDVVRERLNVYQRQTKPLVEFYQSRKGFTRVDGNQPPDVVTSSIEAALNISTADNETSEPSAS